MDEFHQRNVVSDFNKALLGNIVKKKFIKIDKKIHHFKEKKLALSNAPIPSFPRPSVGPENGPRAEKK